MDRFLMTCLVAIFPIFLSAQDAEIGLMFGSSAYSGDITPSSKLLSSGDRHAALSLFGRMDFNRYMAGRVNFTFGKISGNDAVAESAGLRRRNLSFQSSIIELSAVGEFNPLGSNSLGRRFKPYLYGGIAIFHFNPEANYSGQLVELQPLGTEGQGMDGFDAKYRLTQFAVPLGIGARYQVTERINIGFDIGLRKTFTDYLDDVSGSYVNYNDLLAGNGQLAAALGNRQGELTETNEPVILDTGAQRGNDAKQDWYYTAGVTVSYQFSGNKRNFKGRNPTGREFGCPNRIK